MVFKSAADLTQPDRRRDKQTFKQTHWRFPGPYCPQLLRATDSIHIDELTITVLVKAATKKQTDRLIITLNHHHSPSASTSELSSAVTNHRTTVNQTIHTCRHRQRVHISTGYRLCVCVFVCLSVCLYGYDFSAEDEASGVKFWTAVHRHPRQESHILGNSATPEAQNRPLHSLNYKQNWKEPAGLGWLKSEWRSIYSSVACKPRALFREWIYVSPTDILVWHIHFKPCQLTNSLDTIYLTSDHVTACLWVCLCVVHTRWSKLARDSMNALTVTMCLCVCLSVCLWVCVSVCGTYKVVDVGSWQYKCPDSIYFVK